jgi:hypothetical protein
MAMGLLVENLGRARVFFNAADERACKPLNGNFLVHLTIPFVLTAEGSDIL